MMSSLLRAAFIFMLAFGSMHVFAEQITCESRGGRAEACSALVPGSNVQLVQQLSESPCIRGSTWNADNPGSLWVSHGCRAVFDVQPGPGYAGVSSDYDNDTAYNNRPRRYVSYTGRNVPVSACINRITNDQAIDADDIGTSNVRRVSSDLFVVDLNTPRGAIACSVDRYGTVRNINYRY